jgi:lysozyme
MKNVTLLSYKDWELLKESVLILEDSNLPIKDRIQNAISNLKNLPNNLKKQAIIPIIALASSFGIDKEVKAEISMTDPLAKEIIEKEFDVVPYGYNLSLSKKSNDYLSSILKSKYGKKTQQHIQDSEEGVKKIFNDWKTTGIHIQVTQNMYDAIVMVAARKGIDFLRLSDFIKEVKNGRHKQASRNLQKFGNSKEIALFTSYLKNEFSAKESGLSIEVPKGYSVHGIDVSKYQGKINWEKVKEMNTKKGINIDFVFIKATRGAKTIDPKFYTNWQQADNHDIARGAYHYFSPGVSGAEQARNFIKTVELKRTDLPPVLDYEEKASIKEVKIWLKIVEKHYGIKPIIYTGSSFYKDNLGKDFDRYTLWISHGPFEAHRDLNIPGPAVSRKWSFWQFSDKAKIEGIKGDVDFNVFSGKLSDLKKLTIGYQKELDPAEKKVFDEAIKDRSSIKSSRNIENKKAKQKVKTNKPKLLYTPKKIQKR